MLTLQILVERWRECLQDWDVFSFPHRPPAHPYDEHSADASSNGTASSVPCDTQGKYMLSHVGALHDNAALGRLSSKTIWSTPHTEMVETRHDPPAHAPPDAPGTQTHAYNPGKGTDITAFLYDVFRAHDVFSPHTNRMTRHSTRTCVCAVSPCARY